MRSHSNSAYNHRAILVTPQNLFRFSSRLKTSSPPPQAALSDTKERGTRDPFETL